MLNIATTEQERNFMKNRIVGEGKFSEHDSLILDDIVSKKENDSVCPNCAADMFYIERGNSYAIWCADQKECRMWSVMRGL